MLLNKKTQISIYTLNQLMSVNFHIGDKTYKWNILIKNLLFGGKYKVYNFNLKKTFPFLTIFSYFFKKTMKSYKLLVLISKQDLNYLNDWHKFEMFRKLIKSLEETSFSLKNFPNPPNPVRNNVLNPIEYNNILKLRVSNINQHEVKITRFQRAQLLIEKEKNEISRQQLRWQQITGSAKGVVVVAGAAATFVLLPDSDKEKFKDAGKKIQKYFS